MGGGVYCLTCAAKKYRVFEQFSLGYWIMEIRKYWCCHGINYVKIFHNDEIEVETKSRKEEGSRKLRSDLQQGKAEGECRIYISLPKPDEHKNHPFGQVCIELCS